MSDKTKIKTKTKIKPNLTRRGYSPAEVAHMFGIGRSTVYDEIYEKRLGAYKVGSRTIISIESLDAWERLKQAQCQCQS